MHQLEIIKAAANYILAHSDVRPKVGIILGSGLGGLVDDIKVQTKLPYFVIPHFPTSTVKGHEGALLLGTLNDVPVVCMQGRFHYYEGYTMQQVAFPVRVMKYLGVETLIVSNAAGGMNPNFAVGDLMVLTDHINQMGTNPLIGPNEDELGPRFPDMSQPYSHTLINKALAIAQAEGIKLHQGVYAAVTGPTFETPAEYRWLWRIGADAVGMSTVPEVIAARHMGIPCFGVSVITDLGVEGQVHTVSHEEVLEAANGAALQLRKIVKQLVAQV